MANSENAPSRCFSGILRQLLCTGSLQTHPSDLITEPKTTNFDHPEKDLKNEVKARASVTPGIVARLMGLDSMPDINWAPKERRTLDSLLRSRSVNSVGYLPEFDLTQPQHRQVRKSVSFHEVPTFLQQQNHDFFVLRLEKSGESNKTSLRVGKSEMGLEELKQNEAERLSNRENLRERKFEKKKKKENQENKKEACKRKEEPIRFYGKCSSKVDNVNLPNKNKVVHRQPRETPKAKSAVKPINHKKTSVESKSRSKKKSRPAARKVEPFLKTSEKNLSSSPVSALDLPEKASFNVANYDDPSSNSTPTFIADDHALRAGRNRDDKPTKTRGRECYLQLLNEIFSLTEEEMKESNWNMTKKFTNFEDIEEICAEFVQQILDLLIYQVIDELVAYNMKSLHCNSFRK